jgi:hypothetical protein
MGGNKQGRSADGDRISVTQDHELRDWSKRLGVSEARLKNAVERVGNLAYDVRAYLLSGREQEDSSDDAPR